MESNIPDLNNDEALKAENDFIKMKLMLENGAHFQSVSESCTPEMENEFLNYIMEFERQSANPSYIKVFDKIGRPGHFKPVSEVPEEEIEKTVEEALDYLEQYNINLSVCSLNVTARELYRFIVEEFFDHEMDDMDIPGLTHGFIYDEFHPDDVYNNERIAVDDCIRTILSPRPIEYMVHYNRDSLQLNDHFPLSHNEFIAKVSTFQQSFDAMEEVDITEVKCHVEGKYSFASGRYNFNAWIGKEMVPYTGKWLINFEKDEEFDYWNICSVNIEGIRF